MNIKLVKLKYATENYVRWINDPEVTKFLECRFQTYTLKDLTHYIKNLKDNELLFAILLKNIHIGNIKLVIDKIHKIANIGIMIGDKSQWGKGYGTQAIKLAIKYAFDKLKLHKATTGIYAVNKGSIKAFIKAGFVIEGVLKEHYLYNNKYIDNFLLGIINKK